MRRLPQLRGWPLLAALLLPSPARSETAPNLKEAERAYAEVDFERTRDLTRAALAQGKNDHATTARLYLLWATSAAALDQAEESREAFRHVLAAEPTLKLDKTLSPKIRAPYLEARGALTVNDDKPPLQATLEQEQGELELVVRDELDVAEHVVVATRASEQEPFARRRLEVRPMRRLPAPAGAELQFVLQLTDEHDNVLFELGTEKQPRRLALVRPDQVASSGGAPRDVNPTPYYATAATLGALGLASGTAGVVYYLKRENAAEEWNGSGCEQPGSTRAEQCGDVDDRRKRAEALTIGFGAAGGALLIGSVVTLLLAPAKAKTAPHVAVLAAPGELGIMLRSSL